MLRRKQGKLGRGGLSSDGLGRTTLQGRSIRHRRNLNAADWERTAYRLATVPRVRSSSSMFVAVSENEPGSSQTPLPPTSYLEIPFRSSFSPRCPRPIELVGGKGV